MPSVQAEPQPQSVMPAPVILDRVKTIPGVQGAYEYLTKAYTDYGKESSFASIKSTCDLLETQVSQLKDRALPYYEKHVNEVSAIDQLLCSQFDRVEEIASALSSSVKTLQDAVQDRSASTAESVEHRLCGATLAALQQADSVVDALLPDNDNSQKMLKDKKPMQDSEQDSEQEDEGDNTETPLRRRKLGKETKQLLRHARLFATKLQIRAYTQALIRFEGVKQRSEESVAAMKPYTADLIAYARTHLDNIATSGSQQQQLESGAPQKSSNTESDHLALALVDSLPLPNQMARLVKTSIKYSAAQSRNAIDFAVNATSAFPGLLDLPRSAVATAQDRFTDYASSTSRFVTSTAQSVQSSAGDIFVTVRQNEMVKQVEAYAVNTSVFKYLESSPLIEPLLKSLNLASEPAHESYRDVVVHGAHPPETMSAEAKTVH